jgi:hypothetical protein
MARQILAKLAAYAVLRKRAIAHTKSGCYKGPVPSTAFIRSSSSLSKKDFMVLV